MSMSNIVNQFSLEWISTANAFNEQAIKYAEQFGKYLCDLNNQGKPGNAALTTSQIRNYFGEVRGIQAKILKDGFDKHRISFLLLKPKLAYAEARTLSKQHSTRLTEFRKVMDLAHDAVIQCNDKEMAFQRFVDFLEAVLAYHKVYGGKD